MLFKPALFAMPITASIGGLRLLNKFTRFGVRHILSVTVAISACLAIGAIETCAIALAFICRVVLFVICVFLFSSVWVCSIILCRLRLPHRATGKFISHDYKDKWKS